MDNLWITRENLWIKLSTGGVDNFAARVGSSLERRQTPVSCCHVWSLPFAAPAGAVGHRQACVGVLRKRKEIVMPCEMR